MTKKSSSHILLETRLGTPLKLSQATNAYSATLSEEAASYAQERLTRFGLAQDAISSLTDTQTGQVSIQLQKDALDALANNQPFLRATARAPLIRDTGIAAGRG